MDTHVPFLKVSGLHITCRVRKRELLKGVSFTAERGQVTGLIGASGCGKSLTCTAVMDLLPDNLHMEGEVLLNGKPFTGESARAGRGREIACVLQNPISCFDSIFTIRSHFAETMRAHGRSGSDADYANALSEVGLHEAQALLNAYPFQLSGGMLQRVMIALALIMDAPFLIADEPTTDLDAVNQALVLDLLDTLRWERGIGILLVTHDLGVLARLADRIMVMDGGAIVESGTAAEIFRAPTSARAKELLAAHRRLSAGVEARA